MCLGFLLLFCFVFFLTCITLSWCSLSSFLGCLPSPTRTLKLFVLMQKSSGSSLWQIFTVDCVMDKKTTEAQAWWWAGVNKVLRAVGDDDFWPREALLGYLHHSHGLNCKWLPHPKTKHHTCQPPVLELPAEQCCSNAVLQQWSDAPTE